MEIMKMSKKQLKKVNNTIRFFIKSADNAADKAAVADNIEEVERLEAILEELFRMDGVIYSRLNAVKER